MEYTISTALQEECSYFDATCVSSRISDKCVAYCCPSADDASYWNYLIPKDASHVFTKAELSAAATFYKKHKTTGNIISAEVDPLAKSMIAECFVLTDSVRFKRRRNDVSVKLGSDLDEFAKIASAAFPSDRGGIKHLTSCMKKLSEPKKFQHFIASYQGKPCATVGVFRTAHKWSLLVKGSVLPEMQGIGIGQSMLAQVAAKIGRPCFGFVMNENLRKKVLPLFGFRSLGELSVTPIDLKK